MIEFMETKIKLIIDNAIVARTFPGWKWDDNFTPSIKGRVWITWHLRSYDVQVLQKTNQFIHSYVTQMSTGRKFFYNLYLWDEL